MLNKRLRKLVLRRDRYRCQDCGSTKDLHIHELWYEESKDDYEAENPDRCKTVCVWCHAYIYHPYKAMEIINWHFEMETMKKAFLTKWNDRW